MSLKLLGELLLERQNFKIMMMYISDRINLRTIMYMLAEENEQIQFEAFHVFKVGLRGRSGGGGEGRGEGGGKEFI